MTYRAIKYYLFLIVAQSGNLLLATAQDNVIMNFQPSAKVQLLQSLYREQARHQKNLLRYTVPQLQSLHREQARSQNNRQLHAASRNNINQPRPK